MATARQEPKNVIANLFGDISDLLNLDGVNYTGTGRRGNRDFNFTDPIINPGGPNQEELFGVEFGVGPEGFGDRGRENYCKSTYGNDVTPEQCDILDEEGFIAEEASRQADLEDQDLGGPVPSLADLQQSGAEAAFVLPSGEVRTIRPEQDVASRFGRESGTRTFNVDEGSVTVPSNLLADTMGFTVPRLEDIQNVLPPEVATEDTFVPDGRSSFFTESAAREQRMRDKERRPGETKAQRDTRLARSRTLEGRARAEAGGSGVGRDMTFEEARKLIARREYYSGRKESMKTYNERIRQLQAEYNSGPEKALREAARLANEGKRLQNEAAQAKLDEYKKTQTEKYQDLVTVAELFIRDGRLTEEQATLYIIDAMGGDIKKLFTEPSTPSGGSDGKADTPSLVDAIAGRTPNASGFYSDEIEAGIRAVMDANGLSREEAIAALQDAGKLPQYVVEEQVL